MQEALTGFFDLSSWATIEITGKDARDFLQRMSTVHFKSLAPGEIRHGAFLTGKGTVVTLGMFEQVGESFQYFVPPQIRELTAEHIEKFHFAEQLTVSDKTEEWCLFGLWRVERKVVPNLGLKESLKVERVGEEEYWRDDSRPALVWMKAKRARYPQWLETFKKLGLSALGTAQFDYFRIAAGVPEAGKELGSEDIILEGNFDQAVARNKGCYPGQEVVERIFTYGSVNRKLFPVTLGGKSPKPPFALEIDGKEAGEVVGLEAVPGKNEAVGLAFIKKSFWDYSGVMKTPDGQVSAEIARRSK